VPEGVKWLVLKGGRDTTFVGCESYLDGGVSARVQPLSGGDRFNV
jgi:hypothetical protein